MVTHHPCYIYMSSVPRNEPLPLQLGHDRSLVNAFLLLLSWLCWSPGPVVQSLLYWVCEPRRGVRMPPALPPSLQAQHRPGQSEPLEALRSLNHF